LISNEVPYQFAVVLILQVITTEAQSKTTNNIGAALKNPVFQSTAVGQKQANNSGATNKQPAIHQIMPNRFQNTN